MIQHHVARRQIPFIGHTVGDRHLCILIITADLTFKAQLVIKDLCVHQPSADEYIRIVSVFHDAVGDLRSRRIIDISVKAVLLSLILAGTADILQAAGRHQASGKAL